MMTLEEIHVSKINPIIAKEAYDQASKRLADVLDTKKMFEQKAFILFNAYTALALALMSAAGVILKTEALRIPFWPFLLSGLIFVAGASLFAMALLDRKYGALASDPDMWLNKGTIDGDDSVLPLMLAYLTFYHKERIKQGIESNTHKAELIRYGIFVGLAAPLALAAGFV